MTNGIYAGSVASVCVRHDLCYASRPERDLRLDLYLPDAADVPMPVVVWVHGGGWGKGDKEPCPATWLTAHGFAVVSIQYRLSHEAIFPAQIFDCRLAVRWLRAHAAEYGLDTARLGVWGASAGGHLVALLGTLGTRQAIDGESELLEHSSAVQAVCDWFGPTDILRMHDDWSEIDHDAPGSPESRLVGGPVQLRQDVATRANPIAYVTPDVPPFLIMHGDADPLVPFSQSVLLHEALAAVGADVTMVPLPGGGHGGPAFHAPVAAALVREFFRRCLGGQPANSATHDMRHTTDEGQLC